jgi:hypothetical protein
MKRKEREKEKQNKNPQKKITNKKKDLVPQDLTKEVELDLNSFLADKFSILDEKFIVEKKKIFQKGNINTKIFTKDNYYMEIFNCITNKFFEKIISFINKLFFFLNL